MGGNARAIDRKTLQTKRWNNRDAFAQRFEFNEVSSNEFLLLIVQLLEAINVKFFTKTHKQLWKKITDNIFLGSSSHLWNSKVKLESLGDIDIAIPNEFLPDLFDVLSTLEETELFNGVAHKYLLSCLVWSVSHRDDLLLLTDKSPLQFGKLKFKTLHEPIRVCSF